MRLDFRNIIRVLSAVFASFLIFSCSEKLSDLQPVPGAGTSGDNSGRVPDQFSRKVFIYMGLGYNNLSSYLSDDIEELVSNDLPGMYWNDNVLLVFSHKTAKSGDYKTPTSPTLTRICKDLSGNVVRDTLLIIDQGRKAASADVINEVLTYVKNNFPAGSYGMLISSHGTGWAPDGYCYSPSDYDKVSYWSALRAQSKDRPIPKPFLEDLSVDGLPPVKGIGVHQLSSTELTEVDITDLAEAIPMQMDYIIFDACFMGGVEVAYELKGKCRYLVASQTEIIADGMDYQTMMSYLLGADTPDLEGFCENYYQYYNTQSGSYRSATISLVDCSKLDTLAEVCEDIFSRYSEGIAALEGSSYIQKYFRSRYSSEHGWFFDISDIVRKSGATVAEQESFNAALEDCILYKAATPQFIDLKINTHSGLSMYLPYKDKAYLNKFYKTLGWNEATGLVQ